MKQSFIVAFFAMFSLFTTQCAHSQEKRTSQGKSTDMTLFHPDDPNIQYIGRIEDSNPQCIVFTYPGVQIRTGFTGTALDMMCKLHSGYFMAEIDGGKPFKISFLGNTVVSLARDLPAGTHQAVVTYIGEGYENVPEFHGFFVKNGEKLAPATPLPERKIEFIGNSITCGYGIEGQTLFGSHGTNLFPFPPERVEPGQSTPMLLPIQAMFCALARFLTGIRDEAPCGELDEATEENIKWLQARCGLPVTGCLDQATCDSLSRVYETFVARSPRCVISGK